MSRTALEDGMGDNDVKKGFADRGVRRPESGADDDAQPEDAQAGDEGIDNPPIPTAENRRIAEDAGRGPKR
jgi:hypothetical protein